MMTRRLLLLAVFGTFVLAPAASWACGALKPACAPCQKAWCDLDNVWECIGDTLQNGVTCNDGNSCTSGDHCESGSCVGTLSCVPGVPGTPTGPSSSSSGAYTISWTASTGITASSYQLYENGVGIYTTAGLSASISGRLAGTYTYTVTGCNSVGCSAQSAGLTVTVTLPGVPGPMSGPTGTNTTGSFTLAWGASAGSVTGYDLDENGAALQAHLATTSTSVAGKTDGTYSYKVRACGPTGCSAFTSPDLAVAVLLPPGQPGAIVLNGQTQFPPESGAIYTISWSAASGSVNHYELDQSFNSGAWVTTTVAGTSKSYSNQSYGTYAYRVRGCNASGCGPYSGPTPTFNVITSLASFPDSPLAGPSIAIPVTRHD